MIKSVLSVEKVMPSLFWNIVDQLSFHRSNCQRWGESTTVPFSTDWIMKKTDLIKKETPLPKGANECGSHGWREPPFGVKFPLFTWFISAWQNSKLHRTAILTTRFPRQRQLRRFKNKNAVFHFHDSSFPNDPSKIWIIQGFSASLRRTSSF
jgi:hypothetical protein